MRVPSLVLKDVLGSIDASDYWDKMQQALADAGIETQARLVTAGAEFAVQAGVAVDFEHTNLEASHIARTTEAPWMRKVTDTTRLAARTAIINWIESGLGKRGLPDLIEGLKPLFSEERARTIAVTEATRIFAEGNQLAADQDEGIGGMEWHAAEDELMCKICGGHHGKIWPKGEGPRPPAHTRCRCAMIPVSWRYIRQNQAGKWQGGPVPVDTPEQEMLQRTQDQLIEEETQGPPEPPFMVSELQALPTSLKGAHQKTKYKDAQGNEWLFKPDDMSGVAELAAYRINALCGVEAPETYLVTINGQTGTIQRMWTDVTGHVPMSGYASLTERQRKDIQEAHVMDWLTSQHDTNDGALLLTTGGRVRAIDKGQAWKFFPKDKLAPDYNPNNNPLVYNSFFEEAMNGKITALRWDVEARIRYIEQMDDDLFKQIVRPVFEKQVAMGFRQDVDKLVEQAWQRKLTIRRDMDKFYNDLELEALRRNPPAPPAPDTFTLLDDVWVEKVKKSGAMGQAIMVSGEDVEDGAILAYELRRPSGRPGLILDLKLRAHADATLLQAIGQTASPTTGALVGAPGALPDDDVWPYILQVLKHHNYHLDPNSPGFSGATQPLKYAYLKTAAANLHAHHTDAKWSTATTYYNDMIKQMTGKGYGTVMSQGPGEIKSLMMVKNPGATGQFEQWADKQATGKPTGRTSSQNTFTAQRVQPYQVERKMVNGTLMATGNPVPLPSTNTGYEIDLGDGYTAVYVVQGDSNCYSKTGRMQVQVPGWDGDVDKVTKGLEKLRALGLNCDLANEADMELLYLAKLSDVRIEHKKGDFQYEVTGKITPGMTAAEKVNLYKQYYKAHYPAGYALVDTPEYRDAINPHFDSVWAPGAGTRGDLEGGMPYWYRHDVTEAELRSKLKGLTLTHHLGMDGYDPIRTEKIMQTLLDGNMYGTPTEGRFTQGIDRAGGSSSADMGTGGANYFFTRLKTTGQAGQWGHLQLDINLLRRMGNNTYDHDMYGNAQEYARESERAWRVSEWDDIGHGRRGTSKNETCIKNGVSFLDHITTIFCRDAAEKQRVADMLKAAGITRLGGQPVAKVLKVHAPPTHYL